MATIRLSTPNSPYHANIDTEAMDVEIREAFLGVGFITGANQTLSVSMRDSGFEIVYGGIRYDLQDGVIRNLHSPTATVAHETAQPRVAGTTGPQNRSQGCGSAG